MNLNIQNYLYPLFNKIIMHIINNYSTNRNINMKFPLFINNLKYNNIYISFN